MKFRLWRFTPALFLSLLLAHSAAAPAAEELPSAAEIQKKVAAAAGSFPESYREVDETTSSDGLTTIERDYRRGLERRFTFDRGPFHTERGVSHGVAWHMNDNGQVIFDEREPGEAVPEQLTTTVAAVHAPLEGFVIARLNVRGNGTKDYIDAATWRVVRRENVTPNGTIVTTWDDFREDHGRAFPHHVHVEDGYAQTSSDLNVMEYVPDDVDPKDVAMPRPRRALVTFPDDVSSLELPAKFGRSHIYVRVMVGERGLDFVLDTGASGITIDSNVAHELGLPEYGKRSAVTAGRYVTARTIVPEMRIGRIVMRNVAVQEVPQGWQTPDGVKEVGLMGFDFLAELGVTIDYERERVTVAPAALYEPPAGRHVIPLDVRIGSGQPLTNVTLNGALGERWIIDTGGAGTFMIFDYFARRHPEALKDVGANQTGRNRNMYGIGGVIQTRPYQIASLRLGNVNFTDFVGYRVTGSTSYTSNVDGLVGSDFLHYFTLGLDYANSHLYLVPNQKGRAAMGIKD